uniref:Uncharacterized protein n=1 Tax=Lepeophtheirus salmonis TaxID=72036 RepID=A0A0K2UTI0_LEPSM
MSMELQIIGI